MGVIARQSIKASIIGFAGVAIGAISKLFLYTKYLSDSEIGILETISKLGFLLAPFFFIGAPSVIARYFNRFKNERHNAGLIYSYALFLTLFLIPLATIIYLISKDYIFDLYTQAPDLKAYYLLPLIVAIFYGFFNVLKSISLVHLRITVPAVLNGILNRVLIIILLLVYGVYHYINYNQFIYLNIILFYVFPFVLMLLYVVYVIKPTVKKVSFRESLDILKKTSKYNSYLFLGSVSEIVIIAIDVNMISGNLGTSYAGIYTIAFYIGAVIDIPRRNLTNIIFPILNKAIISNDRIKLKSLYQKSSINQFLIGSFVFLVVWLNIDHIFSIIPNGENFSKGKIVVLFIGLGRLFDMLMGVNKQIIELSKYYKYNLFNNILLSILIIILNMVFIRLDSEIFGGINGVAFASLLALIISNLISFSIVLYKEKLHPFTVNHLKIGLVILIGFSLSLFDLSLPALYVILIKTTLLVLLYTLMTLAMNISEDFISLFNTVLVKLFRNKK